VALNANTANATGFVAQGYGTASCATLWEALTDAAGERR
jgi:hypothetical protein